MEVSNVIALLALLSTILGYVLQWGTNKNRENKDDNEVLIKLGVEMEQNTRQLNEIKETLKSIERQVSDSSRTVAKHDSDIATLFKYFDRNLYRIRRLENHVGLKGDDYKDEQ